MSTFNKTLSSPFTNTWMTRFSVLKTGNLNFSFKEFYIYVRWLLVSNNILTFLLRLYLGFKIFCSYSFYWNGIQTFTKNFISKFCSFRVKWIRGWVFIRNNFIANTYMVSFWTFITIIADFTKHIKTFYLYYENSRLYKPLLLYVYFCCFRTKLQHWNF